MATPTIRGKLGTQNAGTAAVPVNVPTDSTAPVVGDWMLVAIVSTVSGTLTISPPSAGSWAQVPAPIAMGTRQLSLFRGVRGTGDPNQYTFTQSTTGAAQSLTASGLGVYGFVGAFSKPASSTNIQTTTKVTTAKANSLALSFQGEATAATEGDSNITVASPFIKDLWTIATSSPINSVLLSHREMPTAGDTGDAVSTWLKSDGTANTTTNRGSIMAVIEPTVDPTPERLAVKMSDGQGAVIDAKLVWYDGTNEIQLAKVERIYPGTKVPELLTMDRVFTMSHRGASADYQEHSLRAYTQSALAHIDAMEFSVARTSDGKYFGLHDATLDRTTSGLSNYKPGEHTWAEISQLQQDLPNRTDTRFGTEPYMLLDDLLDIYGPTHSIFTDLKVIGGAYFGEFISYIKRFRGYRDTIVGKYYHTATNVADLFSSEGMATWGYSYTGDVTGTNADGTAYTGVRTADTAAKWTMLGLEYSATQDTWNQIRAIANGKKVIGHIVTTVAQADSAVDKGARGLQVAGVNAVSAKY